MKTFVVDDEKDIQPLFLQRFRKEIKNGEIEFVFNYSGEEALSNLKQHQNEAVIILSDINMPGMSGLELLEKIKNKNRKPPPVVMMITAYGDEDNYTRAMELGADDFITKPVNFSELKAKIKQLRGK